MSAPRAHCWHGTGGCITATYTVSDEVCCHCAERRVLKIDRPYVTPTGHGPHAPERLLGEGRCVN